MRTMKRTRTFKTGPLWLLGALYLLLQLSMAQAMPTPTPPALPMQFNGFVTVDGGPVPEGTLIEASVNALPCRNATTFAFENQSAYVLSVDCGADGDLVTFSVNGTAGGQSAYFANGTQLNYFNLSNGTPPNHAPTITSTPPLTAAVATLYSYDVQAADMDLDVLEYLLVAAPFGMTIDNESGLILWTPSGGQVGLNAVTVSVTDGELFANQSFTINVSPRPPRQYNLTTLTDGSFRKNLTFNGSGSKTEYLVLPKNATVLAATIDVTGFSVLARNNSIFLDNFDDGDISDWTISQTGSGVVIVSGTQFVSPPLSLFMNSPQSTASMAQATSRSTTLNGSRSYNVSLMFQITGTPIHFISVFKNNESQIHVDRQDQRNLICRYGNTNKNITLLVPNQWYSVLLRYYPTVREYDVYLNGTNRSRCLYSNESVSLGRFLVGDFENGFSNYGSAFWDDINISQDRFNASYPLNPSLDVGNDSDVQWQFVGSFNSTQMTPDFAQELNSFLANCMPVGGNCTIPLVFNSSSAGILQVSNINITYTLPAINSPPVLTAVPNQTVSEDATLTLDWNATDPENDSLTFYTNAASVLPSAFSFNQNTGVFSWRPTFDDNGTYIISFNVTDGEFWDEENVTVVVTNVNRAPSLEPIGNQTVQELSALGIALNATDPDGDALTYGTDAEAVLPSPFSFNATSGLFEWTPTLADEGAYVVTFNVTDGALSDQEIMTITVTGFNRAPRLDNLTNYTVSENATLVVDVNASDPDDDNMTFFTNAGAVIPSPFLFTPATGLFTWTPTFADAGSYAVVFNVTDGSLWDSTEILLTVLNTNRPPNMAAVPNQTIQENATLSISLSASDPDNDSLTFGTTAAAVLPSPFYFNTTTGVFMWMPTFADAGQYIVMFNVTDGAFTDQELASITVQNVNRGPTLQAVGNKTVKETHLLTIALNASDPDNDTLMFATNAAAVLPSAFSFNASTGLFSWRPTLNDSGTYAVSFNATDGQLAATRASTITVVDQPGRRGGSPLFKKQVQEVTEG